jgi:hypothetical protein
LIGETQQRWTSFEDLLDDVAPAYGSVGRVHATNSTVHSDSKLILERIQIAGCLVAADLARLGFGGTLAVRLCRLSPPYTPSEYPHRSNSDLAS